MSDIPTGQDSFEAVSTYLLQADVRAVFRALPRQVAATLGLGLRPTLEALVQAMFDGRAILHWEIVCPACGARGEKHDWPRHAQHDLTCRNCGTTFEVHLDQESQATFSPHPSLRDLAPEADDADFQRQLRQRYPPTTIHELLTIQDFRDWAREQPLPEEEHLAVGRMVIWFSDLAGSTALYERVGDPLGYHLVREHFDLIFDAVHRSQGAVVKTTGDGVMAVFLAGRHALEAAMAAHQAVEEFNRERALPCEKQLGLKIGVHSGPAIAVTLNDRLDYFGASVNLASRLDNLAGGREVIFTQPIFAEPEVQRLVEAHTVDSFQTPVRGVDQPLTAYRLRVPIVRE